MAFTWLRKIPYEARNMCTKMHDSSSTSFSTRLRLHFLHFLWLSLMHLIFSCLWVVSSCKKRFQSTTQQSTNAFGQKSSCPYRSLNTFNVLSIHSKCNETWSLLPTLWEEIVKNSLIFWGLLLSSPFLKSVKILLNLSTCTVRANCSVNTFWEILHFFKTLCCSFIVVICESAELLLRKAENETRIAKILCILQKQNAANTFRTTWKIIFNYEGFQA